jgi:adenosine deaminase
MSSASREWCHELPKCELHAHLSGSIRDETLAEFLRDADDPVVHRQAAPLINSKTGRSLKQCFALFPLIHRLVNTREKVARVVTEVLEDYEHDNCMYLELRTTPRRQSDTLSGQDYVWCVLQAVAEYHRRDPVPSLVCRVLLSVSRDAPVSSAQDTVDMARVFLSLPESHPAYNLVVGLELSGNPTMGKWSDFEPVFSKARLEFDAKLPISLHFGEVLDDAESQEMLDFGPERVGHAVCMSTATAQRLLDMQLPVEVCLSSNMKTLSAPSVAEHPAISILYPAGHPICLCCDDCGIFTTNLSKEYYLASSDGGLSKQDLVRITENSIDMSFAKSSLKSAMVRRVKNFVEEQNSKPVQALNV